MAKLSLSRSLEFGRERVIFVQMKTSRDRVIQWSYHFLNDGTTRDVAEVIERAKDGSFTQSFTIIKRDQDGSVFDVQRNAPRLGIKKEGEPS